MIREVAQSLIDNFNYYDSLDFITHNVGEEKALALAAMPRTSFTERKIAECLSAFCEQLPAPIVLQGKDAASLDILKEDRNTLVKMRANLCTSIDYADTDEQRLKLALEILKVTDKLYDTWDDINMLEAGTPLPVEASKNEIDDIFHGITDVLKLEKIRKNHVSYRSKARKGTRDKALIPFYEAVIAEAERRQRDVSI